MFVLRRRAPRASRQQALACLLFFAAGVSLILVSDLFVFSWRYQLPALVTLVPAGALGISVDHRLDQDPAQYRLVRLDSEKGQVR